MRVRIVSIPVLDQAKALLFYTEKLGFVKKHDVVLTETNRWLTVVAREEQAGAEVLLEPSPENFGPAKLYQRALFEASIPYTQFSVDDVQREYERLEHLGVKFSVKPTALGVVKLAVLDDTCGNYIQLVEMV